MESTVPETVIFDIRGQICPSTLLTALREINRHGAELKAGSLTILFRTDNRDSTRTIPESAENMGYFATVLPCEGYYDITVQKSPV